MEIGSSNPEIQHEVAIVRLILAEESIRGIFRWRSRDDPSVAIHDDQSKLVDASDYKLDPVVFQFLEKKWGLYTIDRFASDTNKQCAMFNAKVCCPGVNAQGCGVDAMTLPWRWEAPKKLHNNWIYPPFNKVGSAIRYLQREAARGTVVVPLDTNAFWWPMVANHKAPGVVDRYVIKRRPGLLHKFGTEPMQTPPRRDLLAVRMDFTHWGVSSFAESA
jgi:hypothetical protein